LIMLSGTWESDESGSVGGLGDVDRKVCGGVADGVVVAVEVRLEGSESCD
jgi:hypothetical protein